MYKSAIRVAPRRIQAPRTLVNNSRRFLSTAPPTQKSRSWKSSAARWALAAGGIYYYNTSNVFAEEPEAAIQRLDDSLHHIQESNQPTIDAIVEEKRQRQAQQAAEERKKEQAAERAFAEGGQVEGEEEGGMGGLEEEADQQGAFNPETGEINWDCPCLGGMAHGPCGEEFKAAFSCFVYSDEEPKGMECIDKFKGMQDCFRQHPEMYGSELEDDEEEVEDEIRAQEAERAQKDAPQPTEQKVTGEPIKEPTPESAAKSSQNREEISPKPIEEAPRESVKATPEAEQKSGDEGSELIPKATFDASSK